MEILNQLITHLAPQQLPFKQDLKSEEDHESQSQDRRVAPLSFDFVHFAQYSFTKILSDWTFCYHLPETEINKLIIEPMPRQNNLYNSIMTLIYIKYSYAYTYDQRNNIINQLIDFVTMQMELNSTIINTLKKTNINKQRLITELHNQQYQTTNVVFYLALVFDINIIIITKQQIEVYSSDQEYDDCKPHLLLYQDETQIFHPIIYDHLAPNQFLTYYDHPIIPLLVKGFKTKMITLKDRLKLKIKLIN